MCRGVLLTSSAAILLALPTCSLNSYRPMVSVQVRLPGPERGHFVRQDRSGPVFPKCVAFSFSSNSAVDTISSAQLRGVVPSCVLLNGIVSPVVSANTATTIGVQLSLPSGQYTVTPVGIHTAGDCGDIADIFSRSLPEVYRLGPSGSFNASDQKYDAVSNYQPSTAINIADSCFPAGWVKTISAGNAFACATTANSAKCWGLNSTGQLGDNSMNASSFPISIQGIALGVSAVSAGATHSCAAVNGEAKCWGDNTDGWLGNNSTTASLVPVSVQGLNSNVTAASAGNNYSCAIVNGGAWCWGYAGSGQLGNNSIATSLIPVQVQGLTSGVTAIATGSDHGCALVNAGALCWGYNGFGQIGNNSFATPFLAPAQVLGLTSGVTAIAAGAGQSCAVVNGGAQCWGRNDKGQLGNNLTATSSVPVQVQGLTSGVTAISTGNSHSCAVVNGGAQCWGDNLNGQLGNNLTVDSLVPVQVQGLFTGVTDITAGYSFSCAIVNGNAKCWGKNTYGQLGNNTIVPSSVPVLVSGIGP